MKQKNKSEERDKQGRFVKGHGFSVETILKIIRSSKGKKLSEETKRKIGLASKGHILSEEARKKISTKNKGKCISEQQKRYLSSIMKGKHLSSATEFKKGYVSPKKGKTFEEMYGIEKARQIKEIHNLKIRGMPAWNKGKKWSEKARQKMSETRIRLKLSEGENHPLFNNWSSLLPYDKNFNEKTKEEIRARDNKCCMLCGIKQEKLRLALAVHHIDYDKKNTKKDNCVSLCNRCHSLTNTNRKKWSCMFRQKLVELYGYDYKNSPQKSQQDGREESQIINKRTKTCFNGGQR